MSTLTVLTIALAFTVVNCEPISTPLDIVGHSVNRILNVAGKAVDTGVQGAGHVVGALEDAVGAGVGGTAHVVGAIGDAVGHFGHGVAGAATGQTGGATVVEENKVQVTQQQQLYPNNYPQGFYPGYQPHSSNYPGNVAPSGYLETFTGGYPGVPVGAYPGGSYQGGYQWTFPSGFPGAPVGVYPGGSYQGGYPWMNQGGFPSVYTVGYTGVYPGGSKTSSAARTSS